MNLRRVGIKTKLAALLAGLAAAMATITAMDFATTLELSGRLHAVKDSSLPRHAAAIRLAALYEEIAAGYEEVAVFGEAGHFEKTEAKVSRFKTELANLLARSTGSDREPLERIGERFNAYCDGVRELIGAMVLDRDMAGRSASDPDRAADVEIAGRAAERLRRQLAVDLDQLVSSNQTEVERSLDSTVESSWSNAQSGLILSICTLICVLAIGSYIAWRIVAPITRLSAMTRRVARGDFELPVERPRWDDDEVADLSIAFRKMAAGLNDSTVSRREVDEIIDSMAGALLVVDSDENVVKVNRATCKLLGFEEDELIGLSLDAIVATPGKWATAMTEEQELAGAGETGVEKTFNAKDGTQIPVTFSSSVLNDRKGHPTGSVCVAQDLRKWKRSADERRQLEHMLAHAQKLESIGQLAAGIAHEINTPTQYVGDNTRFLQEAFDDLLPLVSKLDELVETAAGGAVGSDLVAELKSAIERADVDYLSEEIPRAIGQSIEGVTRVAEIVHAMKEFSHPGGEEKQAVDLNRAIQSTITVARNEWKYVADLETDFDPALPPVPCLPGDFNQVILNIVVNAAHAIGDVVGDGSDEKGTIRVSTRTSDGWAEIRVADTGTGIPEEILARIFDPFFTTKDVGKGTGQGLSIAHGVVVKKHAGTLAVESEVGRGTTFVIRLPLVDPGQEIDNDPSLEEATV